MAHCKRLMVHAEVVFGSTPDTPGSKKSRAGVCNSTVATACATGHASIGISITDSRFRKMEIPSLPSGITITYMNPTSYKC